MSKIAEAKVTCMYCGREFANADFASVLSDNEQLRAESEARRVALEEAKKILEDMKKYLQEQIQPVRGVGLEMEVGLLDTIDAFFDLCGGQK